MKRLSNREYDIMQILWNTGKPMLASDILKADADMNINTIQSTLRNLLSRNMIQIADIITSGKVLARTYEPVVSVDEYILTEFHGILPPGEHCMKSLFTAMLDKSEDKEQTLSELEDLIKEYRNKLAG